MTNYWFQNGMGARHILVDLGSVDDEAARARADQLFAHLSPRNIQIVGHRRLIARLPPKQAAAILQAFPGVREGGAGCYSWCSHSWLETENNDHRKALT